MRKSGKGGVGGIQSLS